VRIPHPCDANPIFLLPATEIAAADDRQKQNTKVLWRRLSFLTLRETRVRFTGPLDGEGGFWIGFEFGSMDFALRLTHGLIQIQYQIAQRRISGMLDRFDRLVAGRAADRQQPLGSFGVRKPL